MSMGSGPSTALELFRGNYNCAQATLAGVLDGFSRGYRSRLALACGFQAGIAQTGRMCGCLSGIIMASGVIVPRNSLDLPGWKQKVSDISREIILAFAEEFGSTECSVIAGCDMSDTSERRRFLIEGGGRSRVCEPMVGRAVEIALEVLKRHELAEWS